MLSPAEHAKAAREAWELGHSILIRHANEFLRQHGIQELVEDAVRTQRYPDSALRSANDQFVEHFQVVESELAGENLLPARRILPWRLGNSLISGARWQEIPDRLAATSEVNRDRNSWLANFIEPMRRHTAEWRERFDRLDANLTPYQTAGDVIKEGLSGKPLKLFEFLRAGKSWTSYSTLKETRCLWRVDDPSDETILRALRRLRDLLNEIGSPIALTIQHQHRREATRDATPEATQAGTRGEAEAGRYGRETS